MNAKPNANEIVKAKRAFVDLRYAAENCDRTNTGCQWRNYLLDAAALLESMQAQLSDEKIVSQSLRNAANGYKAQLAASQRRAQDARNELCLKCGRYREAHNGACDGCRWKE